MTTCPNAPLLRQVFAHIEANLHLWRQHHYRIDLALVHPSVCGTAFCFAGWTAELSNVTWAHAPGDWDDDMIKLPDGSEITADTYAAALLGIEHTRNFLDEIPLFKSCNNLDDLRRIVDELCAEAESPVSP